MAEPVVCSVTPMVRRGPGGEPLYRAECLVEDCGWWWPDTSNWKVARTALTGHMRRVHEIHVPLPKTPPTV